MFGQRLEIVRLVEEPAGVARNQLLLIPLRLAPVSTSTGKSRRRLSRRMNSSSSRPDRRGIRTSSTTASMTLRSSARRSPLYRRRCWRRLDGIASLLPGKLPAAAVAASASRRQPPASVRMTTGDARGRFRRGGFKARFGLPRQRASIAVSRLSRADRFGQHTLDVASQRARVRAGDDDEGMCRACVGDEAEARVYRPLPSRAADRGQRTTRLGVLPSM